MKLALITPGGFGPGGRRSVIPALVGLAGELARRHEVHVFAFGGPGRISRQVLGGAQIHQLGHHSSVDPPGPGRRARRLSRLAWQLARELAPIAARPRFDVLHAFWASEPGLFAGLLGRLLRVPTVLSVGGGEAVWIPDIRYGGAGSAPARTVIALALRAADEITIGSEFARSFVDSCAWARAGVRARIVPLGVARGALEAPPERPAGPPWRLLHVGSLNPVKDHAMLLAAFAQVAAELGEVTLDCVGQDTLSGQVQARARALGLEPRVRFWGFVPPDEMPPFYRAAHLNVLSSRYESQGVTVLEAGVAGLPTVGTPVGLLPTLAPAAASVTPAGDPGALAAAITGLLKDGARRQAMGAAVQAFARAHDVAWTARAFEQIYDRVARR